MAAGQDLCDREVWIYISLGERDSIALISYEVAHGEVRTCRSMNHRPQGDVDGLTLGVVG